MASYQNERSYLGTSLLYIIVTIDPTNFAIIWISGPLPNSYSALLLVFKATHTLYVPDLALPEGESKHAVLWLRHTESDAVVLVDDRGGCYTTTVTDAISAANSLADKFMANFRSVRLRHF